MSPVIVTASVEKKAKAVGITAVCILDTAWNLRSVNKVLLRIDTKSIHCALQWYHAFLLLLQKTLTALEKLALVQTILNVSTPARPSTVTAPTAIATWIITLAQVK